MKLAIVRSEFNSSITSKMERAALKNAKKNGFDETLVLKVPGAFDMPLALKKALENPTVDAAVALGAVVKGDTKHDEVIAFVLAKTIHEMQLKYGKPIGFGVIGPGVEWDQADERAEEYAKRAVEAARKLLRL
jgi:6,7-dimethyl-8-ribityllumazine synthase